MASHAVAQLPGITGVVRIASRSPDFQRISCELDDMVKEVA